MRTIHPDHGGGIAVEPFTPVMGADRRALEAVFRHPSAHNLEWSHVVGLINAIGKIHEKPNSEFVLEVAGRHHLMRRHHTKDLTGNDVIELRHFLVQAGYSAENEAEPSIHPHPTAPDLLIAVDHHAAEVFHFDVTSEAASEHVIRPYDPQHFLHHLVHKDQSRERGQRTPEESAYYEAIANAVAQAGRIVVVGHGTGKSDAAHHLTDYLRSHHRETSSRIVSEVSADLSAVTTPQLLEIARKAVRE